MSELSRRWSILDQAAMVHRLDCEALQSDSADAPLFDLDLAETSDAIVRYGMAARKIYDALKRVIGQAGGLLILAQASSKRDAVDLPSLVSAEEAFAEAREKLASLSAPLRLEVHQRCMEDAANLAGISLTALRAIKMNDREVDVGPALDALSRAYKVLQKASESRFGMMMVDFRHACCTCGALKQ
jgi:hypothetical protein